VIFGFAGCSLDVGRRELRRDGVPVSVEPQVFDLIHFLIRERNRVVSKDDLVRHVWNGRVVSDSALSSRIAVARRAMGDTGRDQRLIRTVPKKGLRFVGAICEISEPAFSAADLTQRATTTIQAPKNKGVATDDDRPLIAVLPFANHGTAPEQDYFVVGMVDEIVTALARIRAFFVISSESSLTLERWAQDGERAAAARLGVRYLLKGSVRRSDDKVRIAVQLVDADRGIQVWAGRFDETLKDIFALQDRIAEQVVAIIEPRVYEAEVRRVARRPIEHLGCYDLYLRAAPLRASCRKSDVTRALEYLDRALALDPNFAPALAQAAGCHSQMFLNGWGKDREWHRREGLALAERAIRAGSEDASVLAQAANALMDLESDVNRAIELVDRATSLNPSCARAWFVSGLVRLAMGYGDRALEHFRTAGRLDPISPLNEAIQVHIGIGRMTQGETSEALRQIRATSYRTPRIHLMLAALYGHFGKNQERRDELDQYHNCSNASVADTIAATVHSEKIAIWLRKGLGLAG